MSNAIQTPMAAQHVPGAEIAVADRGTVSIDRGYGVANLASKAAVARDTRFEIGSITKAFTAAAILQLKEQGKLKLTDPLGKYVPEYAQGKDVTLEQMLWNVSGIPDFLVVNGYPAFWKAANSAPGSFDAVLSLFKNAPLEFKPGTQYEYSNSNWTLLGLVVARASDMSWQAYLRKNIFARAGMTQTAFIEDEPALSDMATGYRTNGKGDLAPSPWVGHWFDGAGSIVSTARDVANWDRAFFGGNVINMQDVTLATTAHVLPSGKSTGEGFAWWTDTFGGQPRYAFTGRTWGFTAMNVYFPKMSEALVVLTNDSDEQVWTILNAAVGALHPAIIQAYLTPAKGEDPSITALVEQWVHRLQTGDIDTAQLSSQLPASEIHEDEEALRKCGDLTAAVYRRTVIDDAGTHYVYRLQFRGASLAMWMTVDRDRKISDISLGLNNGRD